MAKKISGKLAFSIFLGIAVLVIGANQVRLHIINTAVEQGKSAYDQGDNDSAISEYTFANKLIFWDKEKKADNLLWRGVLIMEKKSLLMPCQTLTRQ
ncbi:MAG: hypothetical protein LBI03_04700 [Clostridiales bacterium]|jgi:hypothetical protein|nr:hypothetical protein [Clostridiales bacterium]